jgi:hypothetical protein
VSTISKEADFMIRLRICSLLCLAALLAVPATALADDADVGEMTGDTATATETRATEQTCTAPVLSNPLAGLGDSASYFTAPGGRFEDRGTAGWTLSGNAQYNNPQSPFHVLGSNDQESLRLQPGGSATSPAFCVDLDYPSFRFFLADFEARNASLDVEVVYPEVKTDNVFLSARLTAGKTWELSPDVMLEPERGGTDPGWRKVAIRFTAHGDNADFHIDDLVIDPRMRG